MKRRASLLIEIMVAILIFTTGLIGLAGSIMLALKMVAQSEATTVAEQSAINQYERYMAKRLSKEGASAKPGDYGGVQLSTSPISVAIGTSTSGRITFDLYKFAVDNKKGSEIYVLQGSGD